MWVKKKRLEFSHEWQIKCFSSLFSLLLAAWLAFFSLVWPQKCHREFFLINAVRDIGNVMTREILSAWMKSLQRTNTDRRLRVHFNFLWCFRFDFWRGSILKAIDNFLRLFFVSGRTAKGFLENIVFELMHNWGVAVGFVTSPFYKLSSWFLRRFFKKDCKNAFNKSFVISEHTPGRKITCGFITYAKIL